ncbi:MAG: response regulator [Anaerolineae bacterium]|nr:response regulator [Anaerolineae bacterium]
MKPKRKTRLRAILIVPFVLQTVLAVGLVGYLSFRNGQRAVNDVAQELRNEVSARIEEHLDSFLSAPHQINEVNANLLRQGVLDPADPLVLERHFWEQVQVFDSITSIYFANTQGGLVLGGREGAEGALYTITTEGFVVGDFHKYATDASGNRIELLTTVPDFDARTRPWYRGAVEKGDATWSELYILFTGQDMAIAASRPVYDVAGDLLGVVSIDIFASHLRDFLESLEIGQTGQGFITERNGLLVASSTSENPFTAPEGDQAPRRLYAFESQTPAIQGAALALTERFGDYTHIAGAQQFEFDIDGQRQFAQVTPIRDGYGIDWLVVVVIPEADFMARITANSRLTLALMACALLLAIGVGMVTSGWITRPVLRVNTLARRLAAGEWNQTIDAEWIAEIDELAQSFNHMADQLWKTLEDLTAEIAERKRAQEALEQERAFTDAALDAQRDTFFVFEPETGKAVRWNRAFRELSGYSDEEIAAMKAPDNWYGEEDLKRAAANLEVVIQEGSSVVQLSLLTRDGAAIPTEYAVALIKDSGGNPRYTIATGRDITERQRAAEALQESHRRLEVALTDLQEMQAQLMQQERLAAVGQLAAGIAHDFNNIMATVALYAQMTARDRSLPGPVRQRMITINAQVEHASRLIQQILDFSRRSILERKPVDLLPLFQQQIGILRRTLPETIFLSFDHGEDSYVIQADPTRIRQVVTNLAVNAREAMPQGGTLHITLERIVIDPAAASPEDGLAPGAWVRITISDTGVGIPPEVLPRIFEPFFTTRAPLGSGLGLAQVHGIVAQHEGHLTVVSEVGVGTVFTLYFRALFESPQTARSTATSFPDLSVGNGETILVVEDETAVRQALTESLEMLNYQVLYATEGEGALSLVARRGAEISLIVTDVVMPGMGGTALLRALRDKGICTPVLLLSGYPIQQQLQELAGLDFAGWLPKPPGLEQLAQAVATALGRT